MPFLFSVEGVKEEGGGMELIELSRVLTLLPTEVAVHGQGWMSISCLRPNSMELGKSTTEAPNKQ